MLFRSLRSLLSGLCVTGLLASAAAQRPPDHFHDIVVRVSGQDALARLMRATSGVARVFARARGTSEYRIRPLPGHRLDEAQARLAKLAGAHVVRVEVDRTVPQRDLNSVSGIVTFLHQMEAQEERTGQRAEVDYFEAFREYYERRAFPNDVVDWTAYDRAAKQRGRMRPATVRTSRDANPQWEFTGPRNLDIPYRIYYGVPPLSGRINALAVDPTNGSVIYAGGANGGLWKSTDSGTTWTWLSAAWDLLPVNCVVVHPTNPQTLFVGQGDYRGGVGYGYGILKSTDGGATWTRVGTNTFPTGVGVSKIVIDPDNPQIMVATTGGAPDWYGHIYRSADGGNTWTQQTQIWNAVWTGLTVSAKGQFNSRSYYAICGGWVNQRLLRSDDRGLTWQPVSAPIDTSGDWRHGYDVTASPNFPGTVYVLAADGNERRVLKSTDYGSSWSFITPTFASSDNWSQGTYDFYIACSKRTDGGTPQDVVYIGLIDVAQSTDGGSSWRSVGGPSYDNNSLIHNDQHSIAFDPQNPNRVLLGNDGGAWLLNYDPATGAAPIAPLSKTLGVTQFYSGAWHPTNPSIMLGGTQDNATPTSTGDLQNWKNFGAGDGTGVAINQTNPLIQYNAWQGFNGGGGFFGFYRTQDGWQSREYIQFQSSSDSAPFVPVMATHPANQNLLMAGTRYLHIYNESTRSWATRLGNRNFGESVTAIAGAPGDVNRIFVGTANGRVWTTANLGATWREITTGLPSRAITSLSVSPANPADVLVTLGGSGSAHLYRCADANATTLVWTDVDGSGSTGLPDINTNCIARDLDDPINTWWVGCDVGVFQTTDGGASWSNATRPLGLPNVQVNALQAVPGTRYLNAATFGRGMWRLYLPPASPEVNAVSFAAGSLRGGKSTNLTLTLKTAAGTGGANVTLTANPAGILNLPATATVPAGQTSVTIPVTATMPATTTTVTVSAKTTNTVTGTLVVTTPKLSGTVPLPGYVGADRTVTFEFRNPGSTTAFATRTVTLGANGEFSIADLPAQAMDVSIKPLRYLRRTVRFDLTNDDVTTATFSLINGDADGDNRITTTDFTIVNRAFGKSVGQTGYEVRADLNGDGVVNAADIAIVQANQRQRGD
jgi:photosystem II stability/assembly factor-like uncharacterized protein